MSASDRDRCDEPDTPEVAEPLPFWLIPRRLGSATTGPVPAHMHGAMKLAVEWQQIGIYAEFWEGAGAEENRLYELAGCSAGIGEQVGLACTAERDYLGWDLMRLEGLEAVEAEIAKRALAEVVGYYVLGAGHGLFNLAARTVALDRELKSVLKGKLGTDFPPLSERVEDWPSANPRQAKKLQDVARSSSVPQIRVVADPILTLVDTAEWKQLTDARGSGFHRWSRQTESSAWLSGLPGDRGTASGAWKLGSASRSGKTPR